MKNGFVKSYPHFFRLISRSFWLLVAALLTLAAFVPASLQTAANPGLTPNPAKSAWFLLWIQELVSWSRYMIWPVMVLCILGFLLPWLPGSIHIHRASWFPREQRAVSVLTILLSAAILTLTGIALFFRGSNWSLSF
jgi:hydrogenase-4 membrane subunit HyfE